jgi:hypothetical protein
MEIYGVNPAKDVISNAHANSNPRIVSFLPNPAPTSDNNNTFGGLIRILEGRKMVSKAIYNL